MNKFRTDLLPSFRRTPGPTARFAVNTPMAMPTPSADAWLPACAGMTANVCAGTTARSDRA